MNFQYLYVYRFTLATDYVVCTFLQKHYEDNKIKKTEMGEAYRAHDKQIYDKWTQYFSHKILWEAILDDKSVLEVDIK